MTSLTILLSSLPYTPLAIIAAPVLVILWLSKPGERRLELPNDRWMLAQVALTQDASDQ